MPVGYAWYAVSVRHQNEFKISEIFREKLGLETRVPSQKVWKKKNGKKIVYTRPLLSTYVFMLANLKAINWRLLFSPNGVFGIVRKGSVPAPIPEEQIRCLEKLGESEKPVYECDLSKLKQYDKVEVINGPLMGAVGNFIKINKKTGRFVVVLDLFKRALETELEIDFVKPY